MIDPKDLDYVALSDWGEKSFVTVEEFELRQLKTKLEMAMSKGRIEMLDWFKSLLNSGSTIGMIRLAVHNKRVEITGEGEKA